MNDPTPALIARHGRGEAGAYEALFARYQPSLERFVRSRVDPAFGRLVPIEDLLQETHVEALSSLGTFRYQRPLSFFFWLCGIARNRIRWHARRLRRHPPPVSLHTPSAGSDSSSQELVRVLASPGGRPDEALGLKENLHLLALGLESLGEGRRDALILKYVEGLSASEAASVMGLKPGTFRVLASRALVQLREVLAELLNERAPT